MNELELLPPIPKKECPDCHKHFSHLERCQDRDEQGKLIKRCRNCKKKQVTNKFYIPLKERKNLMGTIGKFSISELEKEQLVEQYKSQGLSSEQAWNKVHWHCKLLKRNYWRWKGRQTIERNRKIRQEQESQLQKQKFLEGLK